MNCNNCGAPLVPGNQFCVNCGAPVQGGFSPTYSPVRPIGFGEAIRNFFTQYATFSGRATRSEYWYVVLFSMIVSVAINGVIGLVPLVGVIILLVFFCKDSGPDNQYGRRKV